MLLRVVILSAWCLACAAQDFAKDVKPILEKRCISCHGPVQQLGGLRLDTRDTLRMVVAGNSDSSKLVQRIISTRKGHVMPPMGPRLTEIEIAKIKRWVEAGAKWPAVK